MDWTWDHSADLVIVGSGGGGMVAALTAVDAGLRPLVIEKQPVIGGSTAMSGGVLWMPNNPLMQREGVSDSYEAGLDYFADVVGDVGDASTPERREMFLSCGSAMIEFLESEGVAFVRCIGYSDYYPDHKGGNTAGRSLEPVPFDARQLGEWQHKINPGLAKGIGLVVKTNELRSLPVFLRSRRTFLTAARVYFRTKWAKLRRQELLTNGMSLIAQITKAAVDRGVEIWIDSPFDELVVDDGRVVGVRLRRNGATVHVEAKRGVLLAAGGFERNREMRQKFSGDQPNEAQWTFANMGNTGDALIAAMDAGARVDLMDEAWWNPVPRPELFRSTLALGRHYPRTILVNKYGRRFCNESNDYVRVGKSMYANDAVPAWLIFDDRYRRRYPNSSPRVFNPQDSSAKRQSILKNARPGEMPREWIDKGWIKRAQTIEELARLIGVDPQQLNSTIERFNVHAVDGEDPEFGRGRTAYNAAMGDPGDKKNPAVGPLDTAPYYATEIYPGDVGTCGGAVTNEFAQVLDEGDRPIPGLYATGNMTASVMGRTYLGAGASIANTMTFGFVAARHAAGNL